MECKLAQQPTCPHGLPDPRTMLDELVAIGLTHLEIGQAVGCSHSSVSRMRSGKQGIDYFVGKGIERLHQQRLPGNYPA